MNTATKNEVVRKPSRPEVHHEAGGPRRSPVSCSRPRCGSDFRVRPASRTACPDCGSFDVATWADNEDQAGLFDCDDPSTEV